MRVSNNDELAISEFSVEYWDRDNEVETLRIGDRIMGCYTLFPFQS